ncbi:MAG: hypothetical protein MHMPM18_002819 [Marteilia pararefringens]
MDGSGARESSPQMSTSDPRDLDRGSLKFEVVAGTVAGLTEHTLIYPFDMLRTRFQCAYGRRHTPTIRSLTSDIYRTEGIRGYFKGMSIITYGAGPAHALYFGIYEYFKKLEEKKGQRTTGILAMSSALSTLAHDSIMVPTDSIKQRYQLKDCKFRSLRSCASCVIRNDGIMSLYRSFFVQLSMNIPFHFANFYTYELTSRLFNTSNEYNPLVHSTCGILSGIAGAVLTNPMDVCKTYLNVEKIRTKAVISNPLTALAMLQRRIGIRGLFAGTIIRSLQVAPSTMASWSVYELAKHLLTEKTNKN